MACLALTVGGTVLGNLLLPGIGSALGSYVGGLVDQQLFGPERETRTVTGPRLQDLRMQSSAYGSGTLFEGITVEQRELRTRVDRIEQRDAVRSGVAPNSGRSGQRASLLAAVSPQARTRGILPPPFRPILQGSSKPSSYRTQVGAPGAQLPVPPFDMRGLLPPFVGTDATTQDRSPYFASMEELAGQMGKTPHRRQLLRNLIAYRALLAGEGYQSGIQFINGSFVENIEGNAGRPPTDLDVLSILNVPQKYLTDQALWDPAGRTFWQTEVANRDWNKRRFSLDTYALLYEELSPTKLIQNVIYWYGLFSHQRETFAWKGFVALAIDPLGDQAALSLLGSA